MCRDTRDRNRERGTYIIDVDIEALHSQRDRHAEVK